MSLFLFAFDTTYAILDIQQWINTLHEAMTMKSTNYTCLISASFDLGEPPASTGDPGCSSPYKNVAILGG
jgi:hypothetical protein